MRIENKLGGFSFHAGLSSSAYILMSQTWQIEKQMVLVNLTSNTPEKQNGFYI